jgi:hypothetical protein
VVAATLARETQARMVRAAGAGPLKDVSWVHCAWSYPAIAYWLNRPYAFESLPETLGEGEVVWVVRWSDTAQRLTKEALRRFGLPGGFTPPAHGSLVFRGHEKPPDANVAFGSMLRLVRWRCVRTLDGDTWLAQAQYHAHDALPLDDTVQRLRIIGPDGQETFRDDARLSWGVNDTGVVTLWRTIPADQAKATATLRIDLVHWNAGTPLKLSTAAAGLPATMRPAEHGVAINGAFAEARAEP